MGLSIRAYAKVRGVSHVAVLKAIKAGRIPIEPDGAIDLGKADAAWERSTDPGRTKSRTKAKPSPETLKPVAAAAVGSVRETLKEQGLPASGPFDKGSGVTFVQARTAHEIAKAHLARLRLRVLSPRASAEPGRYATSRTIACLVWLGLVVLSLAVLAKT